MTTQKAIAKPTEQGQIIALVKSMFGFHSDSELQLYILRCRELGASPLSKEIYPLWFKDENGREVMQLGTGIACRRKAAQRTGEWMGETEPEYFDKEGKSYTLWLRDDYPYACRAGVARLGKDGKAFIMYATVYWEAAAQFNSNGQPRFRWSGKRGVFMLGKCALASAYRIGFPDESSNLYDDAELPILENGGPSYESVKGQDAADLSAIPGAALPQAIHVPSKSGNGLASVNPKGSKMLAAWAKEHGYRGETVVLIRAAQSEGFSMSELNETTFADFANALNRALSKESGLTEKVEA